MDYRVVCGVKRRHATKRKIMSYSGVRTLMISLGAWPLRATLHCRRWCWRNYLEEGSFPSWTLRPPPLGKPSFSSLPPPGESPLSPPRLRGRSPPRSHRTMSPITPGAGNSFEFSWLSSWPSSPAPREVPELAAPSIGRPLGLLAREPDSQPARTSSARHVKGKGV